MNLYEHDPKNFHNNNYSNIDMRNSGSDDDVISIGTWILLLIVLAIPFVNIIGLLVMAFGARNENIKNFGKAILILFVILLIFSLLAKACSF